MDRVRVMKSVHNTIMVVVADNIPNELRLVLGALDVWAYNQMVDVIVKWDIVIMK